MAAPIRPSRSGVEDDGGGTNLDLSANVITVNVTSVNDAPAGTDKTLSVLEDGTLTIVAADFGFTDPLDSPANNFSRVKVTTLPGAGTLKLNGTAVTAGDFVTVTDLNANKLTFEPVANANGSPYTTFTFQVEDDGGGTNLDLSANVITTSM